jgi:GT2 family glycosyltransferase
MRGVLGRCVQNLRGGRVANFYFRNFSSGRAVLIAVSNRVRALIISLVRAVTSRVDLLWVPRERRTPGLWRSQVVRRAVSWQVWDFGERRPALVRLPDRGTISDAIEVCDAEIAIIDLEITKCGIARPIHLPETCPHFEIRSAVLPDVRPPIAPEVGVGCGRDRAMLTAVPIGARFSRPHDLVEYLAYDLMATVASGDILFVGDAGVTSTTSNLLRNRGRASVVLESGYGKKSKSGTCSILQRPDTGSFFKFLVDSDPRSVGAVIFVGSSLPVEELAAACDSKIDAPMWFVDANRRQLSRLERPAAPEKSSWPKISIVMPSFNQAPYLEAAIRSVLDQNYPFLQFIIVDGGSTDGSLDIVSRYREQFSAVIVESDEGQSDALNKGFALATGEIMNWLCSDDLLEPGSLECVASAFLRHRADLIAGGCIRIGATRDEETYRHHNSLRLGVTMPLDALDILKFIRSWESANYFFQPEVFFSRRIWDLSGAMIKNHLFYAMDYDLWLRMALAGATFRHLPVMIGCSRVHPTQKTQSNRVYLHQIRQMMEEYKYLFQSLC